MHGHLGCGQLLDLLRRCVHIFCVSITVTHGAAVSFNNMLAAARALGIRAVYVPKLTAYCAVVAFQHMVAAAQTLRTQTVLFNMPQFAANCAVVHHCFVWVAVAAWALRMRAIYMPGLTAVYTVMLLSCVVAAARTFRIWADVFNVPQLAAACAMVHLSRMIVVAAHKTASLNMTGATVSAPFFLSVIRPQQTLFVENCP